MPDSDAWLAEGAEEIEQQLNTRKGEQEGEPPAADPNELAERFKVGEVCRCLKRLRARFDSTFTTRIRLSN